QDPCTRPRPRHRGRQALGAGAVRGRHPGGEGDPRLVCRARRQLRHRLPRVRRDLQRGLQVARRAAVHPADPGARPGPDRWALRGAERPDDRPPVVADRQGRAQMTLTVAIPFYGDRDMLRRCVTSLRRQTFRDLRILVIGDGQKPGLRPRDSRVQCYTLPTNVGAYFARAVALAATETPWHG